MPLTFQFSYGVLILPNELPLFVKQLICLFFFFISFKVRCSLSIYYSQSQPASSCIYLSSLFGSDFGYSFDFLSLALVLYGVNSVDICLFLCLGCFWELDIDMLYPWPCVGFYMGSSSLRQTISGICERLWSIIYQGVLLTVLELCFLLSKFILGVN